MASCQFAFSNAEAFVEVLVRDLSLLDGENVKCILASEAQVQELLIQLEQSIEEAENIENRLGAYDQILNSVRDTMKKMDKKNHIISIANKNNCCLLQELESIVSKLKLNKMNQNILEEPDFNSPKGLKIAIDAGNALKDVLTCKFDTTLFELTAIQEQQKMLEKYKEKFSRTINRQLNNLFIHFGNEIDDSMDKLELPTHIVVHKQLTCFTKLMHWSKVKY